MKLPFHSAALIIYICCWLQHASKYLKSVAVLLNEDVDSQSVGSLELEIHVCAATLKLFLLLSYMLVLLTPEVPKLRNNVRLRKTLESGDRMNTV